MFSGIPLPKVIADTGPGGNVLTGMQGANQQAISRAQAQYAPQQAYANALLTTQQAQWLPYQYKMQALSNPLLWAAAAQNPALQQQLTTMLSNPMQGTSLAQGSNIKPPSINNSLLGLLFHKLISPTQTSNAVSPQGLNQESSQQGSGIMMNSPDPMTNQRVNPIQNPQGGVGVLPESTIGRVGQGNPLAGVNPASISQAQSSALNTTATSEAAAQSAMWKDIYDTDIHQANGAQNNNNLLDDFKNASNRLGWAERGPIATALGRAPAFTNAASDTDKAAIALGDAVARAQQSGHINIADREIYKGMKPSRDMPTESRQHLVDYISSMNNRIGEKPAFDVKAQQLGLNPQQAQSAWIYYTKKRPFYDGKTNKINEDNLGSWEDFLTPDKIQEALSPKQQKSAEKEMKSSSEVNNDQSLQQPVNGNVKNDQGYISMHEGQKSIKMQTPDKKMWDIDPAHLQEAIDRGARQVGPSYAK